MLKKIDRKCFVARDLEFNLLNSFKKNQEVTCLKRVTSMMRKKYWILKGTLIENTNNLKRERMVNTGMNSLWRAFQHFGDWHSART